MQVRFVLLVVGSFQGQISQPQGSLLGLGTFLEHRWMENWRTGPAVAAAGIELVGLGVVLLQELIGS